VVLSRAATRTSLNIQSFIGSIMSIGVAVATPVLAIKVFEDGRRDGLTVAEAAQTAGVARMRAVLMTSVSMLAGMLPMALGLGEAGGKKTTPLITTTRGGAGFTVLC